MVSNFNIIILGGFVYSFFLYLLYESIDESSLGAKKPKFKLTFIFFGLAGLPPTPLFLIKLWILGTLSGVVWVMTAIIMTLTNSALVRAYYSAFIDSTRSNPERDFLRKNRKNTPMGGVLFMLIVAIFSPYTMCIL